MEPRNLEKLSESNSDVLTVPSRPPARKRRFQIVKLEERIAPIGPLAKSHHNLQCGSGFRTC